MSTHDTRHDYPVADRVEGAAILEPAPAAPEPVPTPVPVPVVAAEEVKVDSVEDYAEDREDREPGREDRDEREPKHAAGKPDAELADRQDGAREPSDPEAAWRDLQLRFVDDPKSAVADAADLIEQAVADLRRRLESTDSTEELRSAFLRYREFYQGLR